MVPSFKKTPWYHSFYFLKVMIMISFKYENNGLDGTELYELNEFLIANIKSITDFFEFNKNLIITIKIFDSKKSLDNYVVSNLSFKLDDYVVGLINSDDDTILCCSYNDYDNTVHKNESFIDYKKMILHECVHILHTYYMAKDNLYFYKYLWEGIASYLTNQYEECNIENVKVENVLNDKVSYRVYLSIIKKIKKKYGLEKLKEILKFDKDSIDILKEII